MNDGELVSLGQLASIRTGNTFRGSDIFSGEGDIAVIQPRDIGDGKITAPTLMVSRHQVKSLSTHELLPGDILVTNKGSRINTLHYTGIPSSAVATSSFFVVSPDLKRILPAFLYWYLTRPQVKETILMRASGSAIPSITKSVIENLEVPAPPLKVQERIVKFIKATEQEQELLKDILKKKEEFASAYIWETIDKHVHYEG